MIMPEGAPQAKRLVLLDASGGHTIIGEQAEPLPLILSIPIEEEQSDLDPSATGSNISGLKLLSFSLIKVRARFALYKQMAAPASSRFNDTFDPAQV